MPAPAMPCVLRVPAILSKEQITDQLSPFGAENPLLDHRPNLLELG
jgi:hypothetical protein